jgi:hypothetical protein
VIDFRDIAPSYEGDIIAMAHILSRISGQLSWNIEEMTAFNQAATLLCAGDVQGATKLLRGRD